MIIDCRSLANALTDDIQQKVGNLETKPHLAIIMVGENPASAVYVRNKMKMCEKVGMQATLKHLPDTTTQPELAKIITELNKDKNIHGILVQSPLPSGIVAQEIFDLIDPRKDVDGFSRDNIAKLYSGDESGITPGTPKGILAIIEKNVKTLRGKNAVIIGKSMIVGKPTGMLLLNRGVTVTYCHSGTSDISTHCREADIIISAVGKKHLITAEMVKPGALVVDVGINVEEGDEGRKLFGDCDTADIAEIADITPVPGGVGPMTIAMLLSNLLSAYEKQIR